MSGETEDSISAWTIDSLRAHLTQVVHEVDRRYELRHTPWLLANRIRLVERCGNSLDRDRPLSRRADLLQVICSIDGCNRPILSRGWCRVHYSRWYTHGDVMWRPPTPEDRFWAKVRKSDSCWQWAGSLNNRGYGQFGLNGGVVLAHRFAYELLAGPIPEGLKIDHLCRVRNCVNPAHLEPVTTQENTLRGMGGRLQPRKTHCPYGHPFTEANTQVHGSGRNCRECMRRRMREYRARLRSKTNGIR